MKHWNESELPDNSLFPEQYKVREVIRESASSTLLLGSDILANNDVVIKCFKASAKGAYLREISATFDISHSNLVNCLNTFHRTDGVACIVYEYLSGGCLTNLIEDQQTLPVATIIACLQAMLNALCYLNSINRIHCDIKPDNILLRARADGQVDYVLIDLGAACFLREAQEGGHVIGTPAYIAPERIKNRFFFNSDLYSLGVIAFEMSTGKRPFTGTVEELTRANLSEIPSLEAIQPPMLRDFIDHLLVKDPQQRMDSAKLALASLNKIVKQSNQLKTLPTKICEHDYAQLTVPITEQPQTIHCFHVDDYPLLALVYPNYVDIIDPLNPRHAYKTLLTTYPLQILGNDLLAYATPSRIQTLNLHDDTYITIREGLSDLKKWHIERNQLVWNNSYHRFYETLNSESIVKYGVPNYLFDSEVKVLTDGSFVTSEGMANNKIVLRNNQAKIEQEWLLDDPIIALSQHDNTFMVITMSLNSGSAYTLWGLTVNQAVRKLVLADNISQLMCINGLAFWLTDKKTLSYCNTSLQPKILNTFTTHVFRFTVCYNHRFIVIDYKGDKNRLFLTILKNRAAL
jgi:serine/threonine protein kinase